MHTRTGSGSSTLDPVQTPISLDNGLSLYKQLLIVCHTFSANVGHYMDVIEGLSGSGPGHITVSLNIVLSKFIAPLRFRFRRATGALWVFPKTPHMYLGEPLIGGRGNGGILAKTSLQCDKAQSDSSSCQLSLSAVMST